MLDAVSLARCLGGYADSSRDLVSALQEYESEMCDRAYRKVRASNLAAQQVHSGSPFSAERLSSRKISPALLDHIREAGVTLTTLSARDISHLDQLVLASIAAFNQGRQCEVPSEKRAKCDYNSEKS